MYIYTLLREILFLYNWIIKLICQQHFIVAGGADINYFK